MTKGLSSFAVVEEDEAVKPSSLVLPEESHMAMPEIFPSVSTFTSMRGIEVGTSIPLSEEFRMFSVLHDLSFFCR